MNTRTLTFLSLGLAGLAVGASALAQDASIAAEQQVQPSPAAEIAAPARADRVVYSVQLPSVQQLTDMARAQGTTVVNVNQTSSDITVTYRLNDNSTRVVSYQLLPTQNSSAPVPGQAEPFVSAPLPPPPAPVQIVEVAPPPPTVVYRYYDRYDPFYDDPFWRPRAPISVNLGFGWGYRGGHYYGGHYRHHHRSGHHRRW
ncbi:MAG: hypothetical protein C0518_13585 [Opitutus sp.]|nr:hypothetical protein [Opitutus sp.]